MNTPIMRKPWDQLSEDEKRERVAEVIKAFKKDIEEGSVVPELLPKPLLLMPVNVYQVYAPDNEVSGSIHGYFLDYDKASEFAKHCGWYGSSGKVSEVLFAYTDGTEYYIAKDIKLTDVEVVKQEAKKLRIEQIKSKLTPEEIELLGLSQPQM